MSIKVKMQNGETVYVHSLFKNSDRSNRKNTKLAKSDATGKWWTMGLSLAPAKTSGFQVCPHATNGCRKACIFTSGYAVVFPLINRMRVAKTRAWFQHREAFKAMLVKEVSQRLSWCEKNGRKLAVRLNVFSDIPWEQVFPDLFAMFPTVQFYDYTKSARRALDHAKGLLPSNYHLTFSRSETNEADALAVLAASGNVAVVFAVKPQAWKAGDRPYTWNGYTVVDGDTTDLRFLDAPGVIGLYAKGSGRKDTSGFVVPGRIPLALAS